MKLVVATRNPGKLREIRSILEGAGGGSIRLVGIEDLGVERTEAEDHLETEPTFSGNALAKARHFRDRTGLPTLADDSGLCVDALDGAPGIRSHRFAPPDRRKRLGTDAANNALVLERLRDVPDDRRTAHFACALALVLDDAERVFMGRVHGHILREPRGTSGFGYDPLFHVPELGRTLAELEPEEKNRISHRARAIAAAREWLDGQAAAETSRRRMR